MAKIPYMKAPRKIVASLALVALMGGATVADQTANEIARYEGYVPVGYRDPVGIPTKCYGEIDDVVLGKRYAFAECERGLNAHIVELLTPVRQCIRDFDRLPDKSKIAIASMTYNIGSGAMCKSSIVQYFNAHNWTRACKRMAEIYKTARGKALPGLVKWRKGESKLCLQGLEEGVTDTAALPVELRQAEVAMCERGGM